MTDKNRQGIQAAQAGRYGDAESLFKQALDEMPGNEGIYGNVIRVMLMRGKTDELLDIHHEKYTKKMKTLSDIQATLVICEAAEKIGRHDDTISILTLLHSQNKGSAATALALSETLFKRHQVKEAKNILVEAIKKDRLDPSLLTNLAVIETELGNYTNAERLYKEVIKIRPNEFLGHYNFSKFMLATGDYTTALEHLQRADTAVSNTPEAAALREQIRSAQTAKNTPLDRIYETINLRDWQKAIQLLEENKFALDDIRWMAAICDLPKQHQKLLINADLCDPEKQVTKHSLCGIDSELINGLIHAVRTDPSLTWNRLDKPTEGGAQTHELLDGSRNPTIERLKNKIAAAYQERFQSKQRLEQTRISGWGVVLEPGGHQKKHIHHDAEFSGVVYLKTPAGMNRASNSAGSICFSGNNKMFIQPYPGLMILFPSYLPHETIPFYNSEERICIAFNIRPE